VDDTTDDTETPNGDLSLEGVYILEARRLESLINVRTFVLTRNMEALLMRTEDCNSKVGLH
jgi:hypothetical protein